MVHVLEQTISLVSLHIKQFPEKEAVTWSKCCVSISMFLLAVAGARAIDRPSLGRFDAGVGPIYLDEVRCNGDEEFLVNCTTSGVGTHNCGHFEDAGVQCEGTR